jgi:hypothetical protein
MGHSLGRIIAMIVKNTLTRIQTTEPLRLELSRKNPPYGGFLMSVERLELSTNGLKGRCSTIELHTLGRGGLKPPSAIPETRVKGMAEAASSRHQPFLGQESQEQQHAILSSPQRSVNHFPYIIMDCPNILRQFPTTLIRIIAHSQSSNSPSLSWVLLLRRGNYAASPKWNGGEAGMGEAPQP